jgi:hypothetical protein
MQLLFPLLLVVLIPTIIAKEVSPVVGFLSFVGFIGFIVLITYLWPYGEWRWKKDREHPL